MREFSLSPLLWRDYSSRPAGRWAGSCRFPRARRPRSKPASAAALSWPAPSPSPGSRSWKCAGPKPPSIRALTLVTLGLGVATANPWLVLLAPALLLYLQERVVKREEAYLTERFGAQYIGYMRKVRRWI